MGEEIFMGRSFVGEERRRREKKEWVEETIGLTARFDWSG
jgi:hypothetical protein